MDAVKAEGTSKFAHHITLDRLTIVNHGIDQQVVGISTKCPAWGWIIRDNVIRGAGTGIYLGNSDGSAPFVGGLIEGNLIVDTVGYNLQIKHQRARPAIMPIEPMQTVIRGNVFSKANGGSAGKLARPNVLLGHFPLSGIGVEDEYRVYGNFFHDNPHESLLQTEGNVSIHDNIFVNGHGDAVRIQPHHAEPRRVLLSHNTIVARGVGIGVSGGDVQHRQAVVANAVFAGTPLQGGEQRWNVTGPYDAADEMLVAPFARLGELDFSPRGRQLDLPVAADNDGLPADRLDFYGRERRTPSAGAIAPGIPAPWRLGR
ncbi:MAG: right-handed parallel beta-helix repeat-containing protein [Rhodocyclaceae bacterium]|nr:right-handed parallel beta-helix repeat-containing protein [Rhodocyclaceae bacterium]